jgi:hypothetical protein
MVVNGSMANPLKSKPAMSLVVAALLIFTGLLIVRPWKPSEPLRDGPRVTYPVAEFSPLARQQFLEGSFKIIRNVKELPRPVLQVFTEQGGSRLLMANPGEKFLATDFIYDSSLPQKRLIFAGVLDDRCFVHYEQGGIGLASILVFFKFSTKDSIEPLWRGYCGHAADLRELRSQVVKDGCNPIPQGMN